MELIMKVNGKMEKLMVKVNFCIQMVICFKDYGKMIKLKVMAFLFAKMDLNIQGIGKMICKTDME
jgi:hypothetical protein